MWGSPTDGSGDPSPLTVGFKIIITASLDDITFGCLHGTPSLDYIWCKCCYFGEKHWYNNNIASINSGMKIGKYPFCRPNYFSISTISFKSHSNFNFNENVEWWWTLEWSFLNWFLDKVYTQTKTTPVTFKEKGLVRWVPSDIYIGTKFTPFCFGTNLKLTFRKMNEKCS